MRSIATLLPFTFVSLLAFGCADQPEEEESSSTSSLKCPSPVDDPSGFRACVKSKTSQDKTTSSSSSSGTSGNGGTSSSSQNGGKIEIGDVSKGNCSSLSISCNNGTCTCRGNGGPEQSCNGSDCQQICCP